jgi:hypothetical protein
VISKLVSIREDSFISSFGVFSESTICLKHPDTKQNVVRNFVFPQILTAEDESGGNTHIAEKGGTIASVSTYNKVSS